MHVLLELTVIPKQSSIDLGKQGYKQKVCGSIHPCIANCSRLSNIRITSYTSSNFSPNAKGCVAKELGLASDPWMPTRLVTCS